GWRSGCTPRATRWWTTTGPLEGGALLPGQDALRIDGAGSLAHLEVYVRPRGAAGPPHFADHLPLPHAVAPADEVLAVVGVDGDPAALVAEDDEVAVPPLHAREDDLAVGGGVDGRSLRRRDVDAVVPDLAPRAEPAVDHPLDGPTQRGGAARRRRTLHGGRGRRRRRRAGRGHLHRTRRPGGGAARGRPGRREDEFAPHREGAGVGDLVPVHEFVQVHAVATRDGVQRLPFADD